VKECITNPWFLVAINGTLVRYFEDVRGLRQEDPLSPYLFVIGMEILLKLVEEVALVQKTFEFYPRCSKM
jgi:hypothetical protein